MVYKNFEEKKIFIFRSKTLISWAIHHGFRKISKKSNFNFSVRDAHFMGYTWVNNHCFGKTS